MDGRKIMMAMRRDPTGLVRAIPFVLGFAASALCSMFLLSPHGISALWPANAFLAAGLLLLDRRGRLWCLAGCIAANVLPSLLGGHDLLRPALLTGLNLVESLVLAGLTRAVCGRNLDFSDGRRLLGFVVGAVFPAALIGAIGLHFLTGIVRMPPNGPQVFLLSHALGAMLVLPTMMVFHNRRRFRAMERPAWEIALALGALTLLAGGIFAARTDAPLITLFFPLMIVVAFRYGPIGAAAGSTLIGLVATELVCSGVSQLVFPGATSLAAKVQSVQFFTTMNLITTLPVAGAVASYARLRSLLAGRTQIAREARARADAAATAKGEFLANMSHEIRTPLNGVIGLADALSRTDLTAKQREMLHMVLDSGKALTGLLSDALDLARADSGALELSPEPFDVKEALGSSALLFETIARNKALNFRVAFDLASPGTASGDALRIKQIVSNLISNAVKFTAQGEVSVLVCLTAPQDGMTRLSVTVRDTGAGFDDEVKARLFKRFEQGDSSITRRHGGSGLGLSIAHRLAQMMGGDITCDSTPGEGSTFNFTVALPTAAVMEAKPEPVSQAPKRRLSILLAEDHPVNRRVVQAMLGDAADLTIAADGQEAVDAFRANSFDLILMDTHMPVMDGLTAILTIRAEERRAGRSRTPIISLTADAMARQMAASLAAGADMHLAKPITGQALYGAIEACMTEKPAPEAAAAG